MESVDLTSLFSGAYKGKRVFLTGHTGFKGSWLALWLQALGAEVVGYALEANTAPSHWDLLQLDMPSVIADIRDLDRLKNEITSFRPDIIFHLAAQPLVRESYIDPVTTYETNIMGTVNVMEAARACASVKAIINVTTDKCYENVEKSEGYCENEPMGGYDPYSSSKGCSELITAAYRRSFFNISNNSNAPMIASARAGNVIGGGDWCKDRIFTDIMKSLKSKEPIQVRNPLAVRPWQHVLEPLSGYLLLGSKAFSANCENYASGWNFGPDNNDLITVKEVVETAIDSWGNGSWNDASTPNALHEANLLQLDITKAKKELEWRPLLSVNESIQYTVDWYKKTEATKSLKYSMSQLQTYVEKAKESNAIWTQK